MELIDTQKFHEIYKPVFIFSKDENYYPCTAEFIIKNSQLYKTTLIDEFGIQKSEHPEFSINQEQNLLIKNFGECTVTDLILNKGNRLISHESSYSGDLNNASVYYFIKKSDKYIDIIYYLMYSHTLTKEDNIPHIVMRVDKYTKKLTSIYFSAHKNDGVWIKKKDIKFIGNSPLIYIARYTHAMYVSEGIQYRYYGLENDVTDFGYAWLQNNMIDIRTSNLEWLSYKGLWPDNIKNILEQDCWNFQTQKNSNWFTRLFPFRCLVNYTSNIPFEEEPVKPIEENTSLPIIQKKEETHRVIIQEDI